MSVDHEKIKRLIALLEENQLTELAVEEDDFSVTIKAESAVADGTPVPAVHAAQPQAHVAVHAADAPESQSAHVAPASAEAVAAENLFQITSLMIGIFYRQPSPDSPPYIEIGDEIEVGQTIGLIEAMKVFSEVPSEVAGRVVAIPAESGKLVQEGDVLVVVDISQTG